MKAFRRVSLLVALVALAIAALAQTHAAAPAKQSPAMAGPTQEQLDAVPRITVDELKQLMRTDKDLVLIDARAPGAWGSGTNLMPGAIRVPPMDAAQHLPQLSKFKNRQVVTYCT